VNPPDLGVRLTPTCRFLNSVICNQEVIACKLYFSISLIELRVLFPELHQLLGLIAAIVKCGLGYCYRRSSVVCRSVCVCVQMLVTLVSPAHMAGRSRCRLGSDSCWPKEPWGPDPPRGRDNFLVIEKHSHSYCCVVRCKEINNGSTAPLLQRTVMLPTGRCHIVLVSPVKNSPLSVRTAHFV